MINNVKQIISSLPKILIDSIKVAFAILGGVGIVVSFTSFSLDSVGKLPAQIGVVVIVYIILVIGTMVVKNKLTKNEVALNIRGMKVIVKEDDILKTTGWRLIPFNEYFDTLVDDVIIAHSSLNGKYIDSLGDDDKEALKLVIVAYSSQDVERNSSYISR
ncbi:MAG: hypothetical protein GX815_07610 [Clostridiales bacterium]|jgi:hypothetical protein|nr:hypothetical protein [Clostridiales bacterium]